MADATEGLKAAIRGDVLAFNGAVAKLFETERRRWSAAWPSRAASRQACG